MLSIECPSNFKEERTYIIQELFSKILVDEILINFSSGNDNKYIIKFNESELLIRDSFFSIIGKNDNYLTTKYIPSKVDWFTDKYSKNRFPVIYGKPEISSNSNSISCEIDLFASSFFMLTRWEEIVLDQKDEHERFEASSAVSVKHGFNNIPVVNYYIELLKCLLVEIGFDAKQFKKHEYSEIFTCDVDSPWDPNFKNPLVFIKSLAGDFLKRKQYKIGISRLSLFFRNILKNKKKDPHYTFNYIYYQIAKRNLKSVFYYIADKPAGNLDTHYSLNDDKIIDLIDSQIKRGDEVGLHGSYLSYNSLEQLKKEYNLLNNTLNGNHQRASLNESRQHYLRWDSAITPQILDKIGIKVDSSIYFANAPGFRSGICYEYNWFDVKSRKKLDLKERPLILMEASILDNWYLGEMTAQGKLNLVKSLKNEVKKFSGQFVLLWHNSRLITKGDRNLFETILDI